MDKYFCLVWLSVIVSVESQSDLQAYPSSLTVFSGGNFSIELTSIDFNFDTIYMCNIRTSQYHLNIDMPVNSAYKEQRVSAHSYGNDTFHMVGNRRCRFSVTSASVGNSGQWTILAKTVNQEYLSYSYIDILDPPRAEKILEAEIGSSVLFDCAESSSSKPNVCSIFSNSGELYSSECSFRLDPVRVNNIGNWTCVMNFAESINQINHTIILVESVKGVKSSVEIEENSIFLKCSLIKTTLKVNWCRVISPTGKIILINNGLTTGRYSSSVTNLGEQLCALRIEFPLDVNLDHGQWRIDIGNSADDFTGCFIKLPNIPHINIPTPKPTFVSTGSAIVKSGSSLRIRCEVPWPASYCYVRRPNGQLVKNEGQPFERRLRVGVCLLTAENVISDDAGKWTCGLSSNNSTEDVLSYTIVIVVTEDLFSPTPILTQGLTSNPFLVCRSTEERPIKYCRFIAPTGKGYAIQPNMSSDARFSYWGMGLERGECGISFDKIYSEDIGVWTCAVTFKSRFQEDTVTMKITENTETDYFRHLKARAPSKNRRLSELKPAA